MRSPVGPSAATDAKGPDGRHGRAGALALPLIFLGAERIGLAVLVPALFVSFFGHVTSIVVYTTTGTSGPSDEEQGLATGLTSMSQQVCVTILSAIAAGHASGLTGIHLALTRQRGRDARGRRPRLDRTAPDHGDDWCR